MKDDYILVFDSGMGGLSVLHELRQLLPQEKYVYFGDSKNAPYGTRPTAQVRDLTFKAVASHLNRGLKAVVVACNTATAAAIGDLRAAYPDLIIIGMEPALKLAADRHPGGRILVMATNVTVREHKFCALMDQFSSSCRVVPLPCPGLVEFIERGQLDSPQLRQHLEALLAPALAQGADAIVLGCTHFPFLKPLLRQIAPGVELLDGGHGAALQTRRRLEAADLLRQGPGSLELTNSLDDPAILTLSQRLLALSL